MVQALLHVDIIILLTICFLAVCQTVHSPAQVGGEHVERLILSDDRMEKSTIGSIDHIALIRRPPIQRAASIHTHKKKQYYLCFCISSVCHVCIYKYRSYFVSLSEGQQTKIGLLNVLHGAVEQE